MTVTHTYDALNVGDQFTFANCLLQRSGMFGISSQHCKEVAVQVASYAQYPKALRVQYLEKGKRTRRQFYVSGELEMLLIVPPVAEAKPDNWLKAGVTSGGMTVRESRYTSCGSRYETDHAAKLEAAGIAPLFYLNPQEQAVMPIVARLIDQTEEGWTNRLVLISELATVAEIIGRCESMAVRKELRGQPILRGYGAPMWDGNGVIRYENAAAAMTIGGE